MEELEIGCGKPTGEKPGEKDSRHHVLRLSLKIP